jgi:hypothetical protein
MANFKSKRREAIRVADDYPGPYAQGYSGSDQNRFWFVRAQSWSEGADVNSYLDVELENDRQLARAQVPWQDKNPGVPSGQRNFQGAGYARSGANVHDPRGR